jgi:hypothetical protein
MNPIPLLKHTTPFRGNSYGIFRKIVMVSATPSIIDQICMSYPPMSSCNIHLQLPTSNSTSLHKTWVVGGYQSEFQIEHTDFNFRYLNWINPQNNEDSLLFLKILKIVDSLEEVGEGLVSSKSESKKFILLVTSSKNKSEKV